MTEAVPVSGMAFPISDRSREEIRDRDLISGDFINFDRAGPGKMKMLDSGSGNTGIDFGNNATFRFRQ